MNALGQGSEMDNAQFLLEITGEDVLSMVSFTDEDGQGAALEVLEGLGGF